MESQSEESYTGFEDEEHVLARQEKASAEAEARAHALQEWEEISKRDPLRIVVAGLGGVGKSTLVNRLFGLRQEENVAEEGSGHSGEATTMAVRRYRHKLKNGVEVIIFDTPGFDDPDINEYCIIADMKLKTEGMLDLMLYCVSVEKKGARVTQGDIRAIRLLTRVFGVELWKKAIFVVTFANMACDRLEKDEYFKLINTIKVKLRTNLLEKARMPNDIVAGIPVVTAGFTDPVILHEENCQNWADRLFGLLLQRNPKVASALLKGKLTKEEFVDMLGYGLAVSVTGGVAGGVAGAGAGAGIGAAIGAIVGAVGGPFGVAAGAAVGSGIGAAVLGIAGIGGAAGVAWNFQKIKDKINIYWQTVKLKRSEKQAEK